jgi:surface protein
MSLVRFPSGRERNVGWSQTYQLPLEDSYGPASAFAGVQVYANDGNMHYSDGDKWVVLLERPIDKPVGLAPTNAIEQTQLRLSGYFSRQGLPHTGTRFEVSSTPDFGPEDILFTREIDEPVELYQITVDDGISYGQEFYWRGAYLSDSQSSDLSAPLLQQYAKPIQDPEPITPSGFITDTLEVSPFETAFPTQFVYGSLNVEIYDSDSVGEIGNLLYSNTLSGAEGGDGEIPLNTFILEDGERYYWRAQYVGIDFLGGGTVTSEWSSPRYFNPVPSTFVLTFDTSIGPNGKTIALPLFGTVDVIVNWGDGTASEAVVSQGWVLHEYPGYEKYTIKISGTVTRYGDISASSFSFSQEKLRTVDAIGEGMGLSSLYYAFDGCKNLIAVPPVIPSGITSLEGTFRGCESFNADISKWDVSSVSDFENTFNGCVNFNQAITTWDVSSANTFIGMFAGCLRFNQPLANWDMRNAVNTSSMFSGCQEFNQPLETWELPLLSNASSMFKDCIKFNQPLNNWGNTATGLTNTNSMFSGCSRFNQPLSNWGMSNVGDISFMFYLCRQFNSDITTWDVGNVLFMAYTFALCDIFDQDISGWDVSNCTSFSHTFYGALVFNQNIGNWDISSATNIVRMFHVARAFNQDISSWNTSSVGDMEGVFYRASNFNQPIGTWDVSAVGTTGSLTGSFSNMFREASAFDQDLSTWNVTNAFATNGMFAFATNINNNNNIGVENWLSAPNRCTNTNFMFENCPFFDADLGAWDMSSVTAIRGMFKGASRFTNGGTNNIGNWTTSNITDMSYTFQDANVFNADISTWDVSAVTAFNYTFWNASAFNQPVGAWTPVAVNSAVNMFLNATSFNQNVSSWFAAPHLPENINLGGLFNNAVAFNNGEVPGNSTAPLTSWDMSNVVNISYMFVGTQFNQDISNWNVSKVENFSRMFARARRFNQNIGQWDVSSGKDFSLMFYDADSFNQDIGEWDVSKGELFTEMFWGANVFNQDISGWNMGNAVVTARMFMYADAFNQPIGSWSMEKVINTSQMFFDASSFDQPLNGWNISKIDLMEEMMSGSTIAGYPPWSTENYSTTLIEWVTSNPRTNVTFHAGDATYNASAAAARQTLIDTYGWNITDGGPAA